MTTEEKEFHLYDRHGRVIEKASNPDLDPDFLKGWWKLHGSTNAADKLLKKPYANHPWVYACASKIAGNLSRLPLRFENQRTTEEVQDEPLRMLFRRPNNMMNQSQMFEAVLLSLLLPTTESPGGQCFLTPTDADGNPIDLRKGQLPVYLYPFNDTMIKPETRDNVWTGRWVFKHLGHEIYFRNDQLIRIRLFNPYDWMKGLSPYSALSITVTSDIKGSALVDKFFDNNATVGSVLTTDQKMVGKQIKDLAQQWADQHEGWVNAGRTAILHSGLQFQSVANNLAELEYTTQKEMTRDTIMAVYGVSKTILGLTETVNRATAQVEKELFWKDTLLPYRDLLWSDINMQFIEAYDPNMLANFDVSGVSVLRGDQSQKIVDMRRLVSEGVPVTEACQTVGLDINLSDYPWLERPLVRGARVDLSTGEIVGAGAPKATGDPGNPAESKADATIEREKDLNFWKAYVKASLDVPEKEFKREYISFLLKQRNRFLDKIDAWAKNNKSLYTKVSFNLRDFLPGKKGEDKIIVEKLDPIYITGIELQNKQMARELEADVSIAPDSAKGLQIRKARYKFLRGVNSTTYNRVGKVLRDTFKQHQGESITAIAKKLKEAEKKYFQGRIAGSAEMIARTETACLANTTRNEIMTEAGVKKHKWVTAGDEDVRATHQHENKNEVEIGKSFPVTGLRYPGENGGAAEEVINCRCVAVAVK